MKKKGNKFLSFVLYFILVLGILCCSAVLFHNYYFESVVISGFSMFPNLNYTEDYYSNHYLQDVRQEFGIVDRHESAINKLERFDIITTYYPFSDYSNYVVGGENEVNSNASIKIKRVYAFPGESLKIEYTNSEEFIGKNCNSTDYQKLANEYVNVYVKKASAFEWGNPISLPFDRFIDYSSGAKNIEITLGENQYYVVGDNYSDSFDCRSTNLPIYKDNIVGKLVAIEGTCLPVYEDGVLKIIEKEYQKPVFF